MADATLPGARQRPRKPALAAPVSDDLLYGVPAVAEHLRVRPRQAHHMIDKGGLPTFRIAGKVCARVSAITVWLADQQHRAEPASRQRRPARPNQLVSLQRPQLAECDAMTLVPFHHAGSTVRAAVRNGEPLFLLAGVCAALDLGDPEQAAEHLVPEARPVIELDHSGPMRAVSALTESGVLALALRAQGMRGRTNKAWLLDEVLPAARQLAGMRLAVPPTIDTTGTRQDEPATLPSPAASSTPAAAAAGGLMPFDFEGRPVRVVTRDGEPWFVAADLAKVLEIGRTDDAVRRLDDEDKGADTIRTPGGDQVMTIVNESGLWSLVLTSRKPEARRFKRWITAEVIPTIRRTGGYRLTPPEETPDQVMARALLLAKETIDRSAVQLAEMAPKVAALERIEGAAGSMSVTDAGKMLGLGQKAIFALLEEHRWLFKRPGGQTWLGFQHQVTAGLLDHRVTTDTNHGRAVVHRQVMVTPKGLAALARLVADGKRTA